MAKRDYIKGAIPFPFVALPKDVLRSPEFARLGASAKALMLDLAAQYTGKNNGRLCSSLEALKPCGWTSRHTLMRARDELLETEFAIRTRIGHPPRTAEWFGFTWWKLDWHDSMDVGSSNWPYLAFALKTIPVVQKQHRYTPKSAPGGAETAPMNPVRDRVSVQKRHHATQEKAEKSIGAETAPGIEVAISGGRQSTGVLVSSAPWDPDPDAPAPPNRPALTVVGGRS